MFVCRITFFVFWGYSFQRDCLYLNSISDISSPEVHCYIIRKYNFNFLLVGYYFRRYYSYLLMSTWYIVVVCCTSHQRDCLKPQTQEERMGEYPNCFTRVINNISN